MGPDLTPKPFRTPPRSVAKGITGASGEHGRVPETLRPVRAPQASRARGNGGALLGGVGRARHGEAVRDQDRPSEPRGARERPAIPRRGHGRRAPAARQPRLGVRRRAPRRSDLHRHGVRRWQGSAGDLEPLRAKARALPRRRRRLHRQGAGARPRVRARLRWPQARPPSRLAGERCSCSYTGEVKLTDFGLARSTLKLQRTAPGIIFGKLSYLAPEQARSEPLDGRTDLYAAGILLWELLTGQQLFPVKLAPSNDQSARRDSTADALERVRNPRVMLPSHVTPRVPPELDAIVMRALAREPARRYQTGEELRADRAAFLAATTPETDAARLRDVPASPVSRRPAPRASVPNARRCCAAPPGCCRAHSAPKCPPSSPRRCRLPPRIPRQRRAPRSPPRPQPPPRCPARARRPTAR